MAIQKKYGKGRLDKWYRLAKEKGYRARAAFKLIQLNKKYNFLEKSKVLIDLCAAPGSWCQVAAECMPTQSLIVGVDLAPIKPIPRAVTFQSDITTEKCRATLRQHLKTWKADAVLHDGAPNVGTAWVQDAFTQAELVLQSMKLAVEFLRPGGTFVTKVFRSKDYNSLLWVFKQLFKTVEATKPPSSRNVSAEIFVVCLGFKAPKHIDPKFLDPRFVFAELQGPNQNNEAKVFNPEKKKRKREGYEEGNYTQYKELPVSEFINTTDPIAILGEYNKLSFTQMPNGDLALATLERLPETTDEVRMCCEDLKVLGKKEFRTLLKWRLKVRDIFGLSSKSKAAKEQAQESEEVAEVQPMDEELAIQEELHRQKEMQNSKKRKERRKENERKRKDLLRMQMHMTTPTDIGLEQVGPFGENSVFNLKTAQRAGDVKKLSAHQMEAEESSSEEEAEDDDADSEEEVDRLEQELDAMYEQYQATKEEKDAKLRAKKARNELRDETFEGFSDVENKSGDEDEDEDGGAVTAPKAPVPKESISNKAAMFFDQDIFHELGDLSGDEEEEEEKEDTKKVDPKKSSKQESKKPEKEVKFEAEDEGSENEDEDEDEDAQQDSSSDEDEYLDTRKKSSKKDDAKKRKAANKPSKEDDQEQDDPRRKDGKLDIDIITAEAMALAHSMATGEKTTSDVVDDGFNKYAFRETDGLPDWFLDDEQKHSKPQKPISAAAAAAIREKLRAINARPIKKVMEAKGRKKMRAAQRLEKLKKKSALLADDEGVSEKDKAQTIAKMMGKAMKKKPKQQVKLVVAKGANRGISGRPKGVKGKYKIVDARLKKDLRAQKRAAAKRKR
ncbi:AdoMet-dependent rRNA methyltransferase spb1 [Ascosphaera atra]|nr:AdoMet-dependent rRNA methyltransferase spb1 [Ascosphaera atra]